MKQITFAMAVFALSAAGLPRAAIAQPASVLTLKGVAWGTIESVISTDIHVVTNMAYVTWSDTANASLMYIQL